MLKVNLLLHLRRLGFQSFVFSFYMRSIRLKESYAEKHCITNFTVCHRSSEVLLDRVDRTGKNNLMLIKFPLLYSEGKF